MSQFTHLNAFDARQMGRDGRLVYEPESVSEVQGIGPDCYVKRSGENEGTFIFDRDGNTLAYVPNCASIGGEWLYYSDDVARVFGVMTWQQKAAERAA
jgi:hypothetical protein